MSTEECPAVVADTENVVVFMDQLMLGIGQALQVLKHIVQSVVIFVVKFCFLGMRSARFKPPHDMRPQVPPILVRPWVIWPEDAETPFVIYVPITPSIWSPGLCGTNKLTQAVSHG